MWNTELSPQKTLQLLFFKAECKRLSEKSRGAVKQLSGHVRFWGPQCLVLIWPICTQC